MLAFQGMNSSRVFRLVEEGANGREGGIVSFFLAPGFAVIAPRVFRSRYRWEEGNNHSIFNLPTYVRTYVQ